VRPTRVNWIQMSGKRRKKEVVFQREGIRRAMG
jgi:hypothetical protein